MAYITDHKPLQVVCVACGYKSQPRWRGTRHDAMTSRSTVGFEVRPFRWRRLSR
jgi:hypothetical protein